jgi:hypothetical protein
MHPTRSYPDEHLAASRLGYRQRPDRRRPGGVNDERAHFRHGSFGS